MEDNKNRIEEKLSLLPAQPGVYIMRDKDADVIYVGKASVLRNRVRSYFRAGGASGGKTQALSSRIADFEYIVTANELEALILECNLIKKYRPKYNVLLKDDKSYPYIKLTLREEYPRAFATRRLVEDGSRYFGPYADVGAMRRTLDFLRKVFPLRTCRKMGKRPCLEFHIKRCLAPCGGGVDKAEYAKMAENVGFFLEGKSESLLNQLKKNMRTAALELRYEQAALLRDQINAIEAVRQQQTAATIAGDADVVGLAQDGGDICVQVFFVRAGKISGRDYFLMTGGDANSERAALAAFIQQYYSKAVSAPAQIICPVALLPEEAGILSYWLSEIKKKKVKLIHPRRGLKKDLLALAAENASALLQEEKARKKAAENRQTASLDPLALALGLPLPPERIDCFDISHIQGAETVASMAVFKGGAASGGDYRRYKIRSTEGKPDDFQAMAEVVLRRYRKYENLPQLIIIDGGKGQLGAALEVIRGLGLDTPAIGLAKRFEEIWLEGASEPLCLPPDSPALLLLRRIRDEAHRFAISYHRKLRARRNLTSILDNIPEIGAARRDALRRRFGSIRAIREASAEELAKVPGMTKKAAEAVKTYFARSEQGFKQGALHN
ncbi:MAG: excinuclease ABC subunit UvrC [Acidaminococcales bacterium]|jgi:excinuclease ABC subunit C|nr:excinuclease ABC subunit UvrC [Acidaminococcales bacterium]